MEAQQDLFISYASADKAKYVQPLAEALCKREVTFWLDTIEMSWGDNLALKINDGLRRCHFVILCLSKNFICRPWPETEMSAALTMQNSDGAKKVLPLILDSKDEVLRRYPLIAALIYREFSEGPEKLANELASLVTKRQPTDDQLHLIIESVHTGKLSNLVVSPRVSIMWLIEQAKLGAGLKDSLDTGGFMPFRIRWVLIDANAESEWKAMDRYDKQNILAMVKNKDGKLRISYSERDRLEGMSVDDNTVFHLYALEDWSFEVYHDIG